MDVSSHGSQSVRSSLAWNSNRLNMIVDELNSDIKGRSHRQMQTSEEHKNDMSSDSVYTSQISRLDPDMVDTPANDSGELDVGSNRFCNGGD